MSADNPRPPTAGPEQTPLICSRHQVPLEPGKVDLTYQGHTFPVEALCCPVCGLAFIPEDLARGRMREVEQTLEQK